MDHSYILKNNTRRDLTISKVINRKTCCGSVQVGETLLHPGDRTEVSVKLTVGGGRFGSVVHETEIVTEPPSSQEIVLRTSADVSPSLRVESDSSANPKILLGASEPHRIECQAFAYGTTSEPPVDLDRLNLRSTLEVEWVGQKEDVPNDDGLKVESRRFSVSLKPDGQPGDRRASVEILHGDQSLLSHVLNWELVSPIAASPKMLVFKSGQKSSTILLRSEDQKPFQIERVECDTSGIHGRDVSPSSALTHVVEIKGTPTPGKGRSIVKVLTDHPSQAEIQIPFIVID